MSESRFAGRSYFLEGPDGREQLNASYDECADVLYLWRGDDPREAISFHTEDGPLVRVDPSTGELVGVTLLDWWTTWADKQRIDLDVPRVGPRERDATEASAHRELVTA